MTETVAIPVKDKRMTFDRVLLLVTVGLLFLLVGFVGVIAWNTNDAVKSPEFREETEQVIDHRVRNEIAHSAICEKVDAVVRYFGIDPADLRDGNGQPVECPKPLSKSEIRQLRGH